MTANSLKSTTAILVAMSLLQPWPALAQSGSGATAGNAGGGLLNSRTPEEICSEAGIFDETACELFILDLEAAAADEATDDGADTDMDELETQADAEAEAEAEALAAEEAEADAQAAADAEAEAEAEARAAEEAEARAAEEAAADAQAAADAEAEAEAEARAAEEAEALATEEAEADAQAAADAEAEAEAEARAAEEAEALATEEAEADAQAAADDEADAAARAAAEAEALAAEACLAEVVAPDGTIIGVDTLTGDAIAALAADEGVETEEAEEVTTETVTEETRRSSSEEFRDWTREDRERLEETEEGVTTAAQPRSGLSDLERAGLFVLGAAVVGAILTSGQRVESNTGDRIIVLDDDGVYRVLKDDDALLRQPGSEVRTERYADGSTRTEVTREDGTRIVTIRDSSGRALRRVRIEPDGREYLLIDDTRDFEPVIVRDLPRPAHETFDYRAASDRESLRLALLAADRRDIGRSFSLRQVREYVEVRELAPEINIGGLTFATNSAAIEQSQAEDLREMGLLMRDLIRDDPTELFLIEGHTDAIGSAGYNLLLSDRRAESVALAFTEYFGVPAENMIVQGYGERFLKIPTQEAERLNRRVAVRRITALVRQN